MYSSQGNFVIQQEDEIYLHTVTRPSISAARISLLLRYSILNLSHITSECRTVAFCACTVIHNISYRIWGIFIILHTKLHHSSLNSPVFSADKLNIKWTFSHKRHIIILHSTNTLKNAYFSTFCCQASLLNPALDGSSADKTYQTRESAMLLQLVAGNYNVRTLNDVFQRS